MNLLFALWRRRRRVYIHIRVNAARLAHLSISALFLYIYFPFTVPVVSTVPGNAQAFSESVLAKVTPAKKRRRERDGE